MKYHAFTVLEDVYEKTKKRLFPFKWKEWFKLGFVNLLSNPVGSGSGGRISSTTFEPSFNNTVGVQTMSTYAAPLIPLLILFPFLFIILAVYVNALFTFVFLHSITNKETKIKQGIRIYTKNANSLFQFNIILFISLITLLFLFGISAFYLLANAGLAVSILTIIFLSALLILLILLFLIILLVVNEIVVPIMFFKKKNISSAWNYSKSLIKKEFKQILVFLFVLCIVNAIGTVAISAIVIFYSLLLVIFVLPIIAFTLLINQIWFSIVLSSVLLLVSVYVISVLSIPVTVFIKNYTLVFISKVDKNVTY